MALHKPSAKYHPLFLSVCGVLALLSAAIQPPLLAYHLVHTAGTVLKWPAFPVNFVVDNGSIDILPEIQAAFDTWNAVPTAQNVLGTAVRATVDFNGANFGTAWGILTGDGRQEIVLDQDGSAFARLGLDPAVMNAFSPITSAGGVITDVYVLINGTRSDFDRPSTELHELGHVQGLGHSSVGIYNSASFPSDALDPVSASSLPTMHPFVVPAAPAARRTLKPDDMAGLSELYPEPSFSTLGSIEGTVTRCGSNNPVTGANVRAINTANANIQLTRFSGYDGNTQGRFLINGLPPGSYRLVVETVTANGFSIDRFGRVPAIAETDFPTEYHNPPQEDACTEELPDSPVNVAVSAGATAAGRNFKVSTVDLAFVIDDTGSMAPEISAVRSILTTFVDNLRTSSSTAGTPFPNTAIVTFKDDVTKRLISNNPARLQTVINALFASGGGDCPESSNAGVLSAGRLLKNGGVAMLFTDADSRPDGPDRAATEQLFRSKSLTLSTLLSGTCTGTISSPVVSAFSASYSSSIDWPSSDRTISDSTNSELNPADSANFDEFPLPRTLGPESAVRTYSEISRETGGFFIAIPGIQTGSAVERQRYVNTGTNIAVSSVAPAIGLISPGDAPQGSTLNIQITGQNTNFINGSSAVSFGGTGITVNSATVISPQKILANVSIDPGAALGFRDTIVNTNLGGGRIEMARGVGALQITAAPTSPTITSVSPPEGSQGQTLDVLITGAATNFANGVSVVNLGSGITVNSTTVLTSTSLRANITINNAATVGYRDVRVTTGTETAVENLVGPFLVTAPSAPIARLLTINPVQGSQGQTLNITVTGQNTNFLNGVSIASFSGTGITVNGTTVVSPTSATINLSIAGSAAPGFRDVSVKTGAETAVILSAFQILSVAVERPNISGAITGKGVQAPDVFFLDLKLTNNGPGFAQGLRIDQILFRTLAGSGLVTYNTSLSMALPITIGNLAPGSSTTVRIYVNVPPTVSRFTLTENGSVQDTAGVPFGFSMGQAVFR